MQQQDGAQTGDGVFGGCAAGSLIIHLIVVAVGIQVALQGVGKGLAGLKAVAGGDAVAIADQDGTSGGLPLSGQSRAGHENQPERND